MNEIKTRSDRKTYWTDKHTADGSPEKYNSLAMISKIKEGIWNR